MTGRTCCCGCCSVRDGTRIIAVLSIIGALYGLYDQITSMVALSDDPATIANRAGLDAQQREALEQFLRDYQSALLVLWAVAALFALIQLILSGMLLHGAQNNMESRCRPWYQYNLFILTLFIFFVVIVAVIVMISWSGLLGFLMLAVLAIPVGLQAYFLNVVHEYMLELRQGQGATLQAGCVYSAPLNPNFANSRVMI